MGSDKSIPTKVKVFGIIHIIYAALGVIMIIMGLMFSSGVTIGGPGNDPASEEMKAIEAQYQEIPQVQAVTYGGFIVGGLMCVLLIIAGVHLLKHKILGRTLSLVYASSGIIIAVIQAVLTFLLISKYKAELILASDLPENVQDILLLTQGKIAPAGMLFCGLVYPVILLIFMLPEKFARLFPDYVPEEDEEDEIPENSFNKNSTE